MRPQHAIQKHDEKCFVAASRTAPNKSRGRGVRKGMRIGVQHSSLFCGLAIGVGRKLHMFKSSLPVQHHQWL